MTLFRNTRRLHARDGNGSLQVVQGDAAAVHLDVRGATIKDAS